MTLYKERKSLCRSDRTRFTLRSECVYMNHVKVMSTSLRVIIMLWLLLTEASMSHLLRSSFPDPILSVGDISTIAHSPRRFHHWTHPNCAHTSLSFNKSQNDAKKQLLTTSSCHTSWLIEFDLAAARKDQISHCIAGEDVFIVQQQ